MKKQPFKKIKEATSSDLSLHNVKEIMNAFFSSSTVRNITPQA